MLKILILKRQLDAKRSELKALEEKDAEFQTREADLETAIGEVEPGNAEQEAAVTAEVDAFEADKTAHETAKQTLSADIEHLETELADLERQAPAAKTPEKREKVRGDVHMETQINIRSLPMGRRAFDALPMEQRQAIVAPPLPFVCYLFASTNNFNADDAVYQVINRITIELYTESKDPEAENAVETALKDLCWEKSEEYLDDEQCYEIIYEIEV